jgi:ribonuclease P protein component
MKRAYRLRKPEHFQRVRREGKTVRGSYMLLNIATSRRKTLRFGFVVSKQLGGAVQRNRAKRRVREAVRLVAGSINPGNDLVFVIHSINVTTLAFETLQAEVISLLQRAKVWREQTTLTIP